MEKKLSAFHMEQMNVYRDEQISMLFNSMMQSDNEHIDDLKKAFVGVL